MSVGVLRHTGPRPVHPRVPRGYGLCVPGPRPGGFSTLTSDPRHSPSVTPPERDGGRHPRGMGEGPSSRAGAGCGGATARFHAVRFAPYGFAPRGGGTPYGFPPRGDAPGARLSSPDPAQPWLCPARPAVPVRSTVDAPPVRPAVRRRLARRVSRRHRPRSAAALRPGGLRPGRRGAGVGRRDPDRRRHDPRRQPPAAGQRARAACRPGRRGPPRIPAEGYRQRLGRPGPGGTLLAHRRREGPLHDRQGRRTRPRARHRRRHRAARRRTRLAAAPDAPVRRVRRPAAHGRGRWPDPHPTPHPGARRRAASWSSPRSSSATRTPPASSAPAPTRAAGCGCWRPAPSATSSSCATSPPPPAPARSP
ncbi:hypothetical protein SHIRM173S_10287 [Streptomyces hirsutus]